MDYQLSKDNSLQNCKLKSLIEETLLLKDNFEYLRINHCLTEGNAIADMLANDGVEQLPFSSMISELKTENRE